MTLTQQQAQPLEIKTPSVKYIPHLITTLMHILLITKNPKKTSKIKEEFWLSNIISTVATPNEIDKIWFSQFHLVQIQPPISELECKNLIKIIRNLNWEIPILSPFPIDGPANNIIIIPQNITLRELKRTIKTTVDSQENKNMTKIKRRDLTLDLQRKIVRRKNKAERLRRKEFGILELLMKNYGAIVSKNEIIETLWDRNTTITSNTIEVHMVSLRKKIDQGFTKKLIRTIPCMGYQLGE